MTDTAFTDLIDEVQLFTESVPRATIVQFIRRACITLCRNSRVWKLSGSDGLVAGENDICVEGWFNAPGSTERQLLVIEELRYDGSPLTRYTEKQLKALNTSFGSVSAYYQTSLHMVQLLSVPDAFYENDDFIDWTISVMPSETATGMDEVLVQRYREGIVAGAVGMLFGMPRKTWSSPQFAPQYMAVFAKTISDAQLDANQEFARRIPRVVRYGGI